MAQSMLMKRGLEGLFSPEKKFEAEASYGRKILYVAWAVEILAATIGLTIAWATAYDAYANIENPDSHHLINALIGALPFLIIAVIEPTKIPLAGGFYKTRILSWKLLILVALLGLTAVTFETMFNGLERNLTNVTKKVVDSDNRIRYLTDQITEKQRLLDDLQSKSIAEITQGLTDQVDKLTDDYNAFVDEENASLTAQLAPLNKQKLDLGLQQADLAGRNTTTTNNQIQLLQNNITSLENQIKSIEQARDEEIKAYEDSVTRLGDDADKANRKKVEGLNAQKEQKKSEIDQLKKEKIDSEKRTKDEIRLLDQDYTKDLDRITKEKTEALAKCNIFCDKTQKAQPFEDQIAARKNSYAANRRRVDEAYKQIVEANDKRIAELLQAITNIDKNITDILNSEGSGATPVDQNKIDAIRATAKNRIDNLQNDIKKFQNEITESVSANSGASNREIARIQAQIQAIDTEIKRLTTESSKRIADRKLRFSEEERAISEQINKLALNTTEEKKRIPQIESEIESFQSEIDQNKKVKREASYDSQVYRLAALAYGKTDVADVTRDEIKVVSVVWFGSIALIVSTIGTVLALISYILRDPEAFVERKKFSLTRRINRIFYLIFWRMNGVLMSGIRLLLATAKLIISFAEIFRGLIGLPVQRAIRRAALAYRKRLNKPRIVEVEKEVEVERTVEKIVEVEVPVEKVVIQEVPVEKVVIQEVPVEIVRKELVYVPLYSTDSGLIDASTELKGARPKISDGLEEQTRAQQDVTVREKTAATRNNNKKKSG